MPGSEQRIGQQPGTRELGQHRGMPDVGEPVVTDGHQGVAATASGVGVSCEQRPPAAEQLVHARGADDRLRRSRQLDGMQDERPGLRAAEAAVERDQLLKCAALLELRVIEAADHDVRHVLEAVGAEQMCGRVRGERRERILALDAAVGEVVSAAGIDRQRPVLRRVNEQEADMRMRAERRQQVWMALVDLLGGQAALLVHQIDQAEVARAEHHRAVVAAGRDPPETASGSVAS